MKKYIFSNLLIVLAIFQLQAQEPAIIHQYGKEKLNSEDSFFQNKFYQAFSITPENRSRVRLASNASENIYLQIQETGGQYSAISPVSYHPVIDTNLNAGQYTIFVFSNKEITNESEKSKYSLDFDIDIFIAPESIVAPNATASFCDRLKGTIAQKPFGFVFMLSNKNFTNSSSTKTIDFKLTPSGRSQIIDYNYFQEILFSFSDKDEAIKKFKEYASQMKDCLRSNWELDESIETSDDIPHILVARRNSNDEIFLRLMHFNANGPYNLELRY